MERGSGRKTNKEGNKIKPLNVLNVYSEGTGICVEQEMIEEKTNEIAAIPDVIKRLNLKGIVCTWDALNTQKRDSKSSNRRKRRLCRSIKRKSRKLLSRCNRLL